MNKNTIPQVAGKPDRQQKILEIVRTETVRTQVDLVKLLKKSGFSSTQVSVSRDVRELGLIKSNGRYVVPDENPTRPGIEELARTSARFLIDATPVGENLVVVHTHPGTAHSVALLLDQLDWPDLAGTVAGDDTIFVAVHSTATGRELVGYLNSLMK